MWTAIGIIALVLAFGINYYFVRRNTAPGARAGSTYWLKVGLYYLLMVLGMAARELYNTLAHAAKFNWVSFAIAAIVSPVCFGAIYDRLLNMDLGLPSLLLAFQNGFFWNAVFEGLGPG